MGAGWFWLDGVDDPKAPVERKNGAFVFFREMGRQPAKNAGGRSLADVDHCGQVICKMGGPFSATRSPSELASTGYVADADRPVPGRTEIPFHIRVEREQISVLIKCQVERVTKAGANESKLVAFRIKLGDPAAVGGHIVVMTIGIQ